MNEGLIVPATFLRHITRMKRSLLFNPPSFLRAIHPGGLMALSRQDA